MPKHTPLHEEHIKLGAKMVDFAGWAMPVQYTGVIEEHRAVRNAAGLFDVSHMGELEFAGPDAEKCVQRLTTNDVTKMQDGKAQYSIICNERGTVVDDVIVYRFSKERFILVVNASNVAKDFEWCKMHATGNVSIKDRSDDFALIAFQGPKALAILKGLADFNTTDIQKYCFSSGSIADMNDCIVARTGYTGEDGFEIFTPPNGAVHVWQALIEKGLPQGILPAGLGARDTLRLEMKYSLYGHEISDETNPFESGLSWVVKMDKPDGFIGRDALLSFKAKGMARRLVGFKMTEPGIPRQGYSIIADGKVAGIVTSGTMSPSMNIAIGIGFVPVTKSAVGTKISVDIRGRPREATVVETPFYKK